MPSYKPREQAMSPQWRSDYEGEYYRTDYEGEYYDDGHRFGNEWVTPEEEARRRNDIEAVYLLREARLLRPRLRGVFALRALCHRGRAAPTSATPSAFARLIGSAPASKPRTRAAAKVRSSPGLPDPLAHLVCKFWLGSPPRRRRVNH